MDDLISRDEALSVLGRIFEKYNISFNSGAGGFSDEVPEAIESIPTAYDVDKVMKKLEENAKSYEDPASSDGGFRKFCRGIATGFRYAMKIVEGGGLDDE
jgi:hypothetical protein